VVALQRRRDVGPAASVGGALGPRYVVSAELGVPRRAWPALRLGAVRFGTLVEDGDRLELRAYLPAAGLGRPTLDHTLHAVAYEAARLPSVSTCLRQRPGS